MSGDVPTDITSCLLSHQVMTFYLFTFENILNPYAYVVKLQLNINKKK